MPPAPDAAPPRPDPVEAGVGDAADGPGDWAEVFWPEPGRSGLSGLLGLLGTPGWYLGHRKRVGRGPPALARISIWLLWAFILQYL